MGDYTQDRAADGRARTTLQRRLSAIRRLARMAALADYGNPRREAALQSLALFKVNVGHASERSLRAFSPAEVERALCAWDETSVLHTRNRAMIALLFSTGMRRSELAALKWEEINFDEGTALIRHGKGDKARHAAIYGEAALRALRAWRAHMDGARVYIFPRMHKGDEIGEDAPITPDGVYYVVKETAKRTGEVFHPHDARRTFITEALVTGTPVQDVQADAGHARGSTTLLYAQPSDARERRKRGRLRYG